MKFKKLLSVILIISILGSISVFTGVFSGEAQSSSSALLEQFDQLEKEQQELQERLQKIKSQKNAESDYIATLQEQIANTEAQIELINSQITELNNNASQLTLEIETLERDIEQKQASVDSNWETFKMRLRAMYMAGNTSTFEMLISASSLTDFLSRSEMLRSVTKHDTDLINTLKSDIDSMTSNKAQLEENLKTLKETQAQIESSKVEYDEKQSQLASEWAESNELVASLADSVNSYSEELERQWDEMDAINAELSEIYGIERPPVQRPTGDPDNGSFIWPIPGVYTVSSKYGYRWGRLHAGVDLSNGNTYGRAIVASRSGVIIARRSSSSGYGKYLIIDHGDGYTTLYAHCSELLVSEGDYVTQGQTIAKAGSSGNSTGAHLHFEIRINGNAVDPLPYIQ